MSSGKGWGVRVVGHPREVLMLRGKSASWLSIAVVVVLLGSASSARAAAFSSTQSGPWNASATWGGAGVPATGDTVTINGGHVVEVTDSRQCLSVSMPNASGSRELRIASGVILQLEDATTGLQLDPSSDGVNLLNIDGGTLRTLNGGDVNVVGGGLAVARISFSTNNGTLDISGDLTFSGTVTNAQLQFLGTNGIVTIAGNLSSGGQLTTAGSTFEFDGTVNQSIGGPYTFDNLTINNSGAGTNVSLTANTFINGDVTINAGSFADAGFTITPSGSSAFTMASGTKFEIGGSTSATTFPGFTPITLNSGSTVIYKSDDTINPQTISTVPTYANLAMTMTAGGSVERDWTGTINVSENLDVSNGPGSVTLKQNNWNLFVAGDITGNGTIDVSGGVINVGGDFSHTGTFTQALSLVQYVGAGPQQVKSTTYYNFNCNKSAGTATLLGAITVTNSFLVQSGTLDDAGFAINMTTGTVQLDAGTTLSLGSAASPTSFPATSGALTIASTSTVEYKSNAAQTIKDLSTPPYGNLRIKNSNGAASHSLSGNTAVTNQLEVDNGTGTTTLNVGTFLLDVGADITGTGSISAGATTISVGGSWLSTGTFTAGTSQVIYDATSGTHQMKTAAYYSLRVDDSNLGATFTVGTGTTTVSLTFEITNGTVNLGGNTLDIAGDFINDTNGVFNGGTGTLEVAGSFTNNGAISPQTGTVILDGPVKQTVASFGVMSFNNLTVTNAANEIDFTQNTSVSGTLLDMGSARLDMDPTKQLFIDVGTTVNRTTGYVTGKLAMGMNTGVPRIFPIGSLAVNSYMPVEVNPGNPGSLAVEVVDGLHPNDTGSNTLSQYWTVTGGTVTSVNSFQFSYNDTDINAGTELNFVLARYNAGWTIFGAVDDGSNLVSAAAPSPFLGDWAIGEPGSLGAASKLAITAIAPASPYRGHPFSVTVEAQDDNNSPANVVNNTPISITKLTGCLCTGTLSGTTTGTINAGTNSVTIGVMAWNTIEANVQLEAARTSGDVLTSATSAAINIQTPPGMLTVTNVNDSGSGSLREALTILENDGCTAPCTINFNTLGNIVLTTTGLPSITKANTTIDAISGNIGAAFNTNAFGTGLNTTLGVSIDRGAVAATYGLHVQANNVTISGLGIRNFVSAGSGKGIFLDNVTSGKVAGCYIGVDNDGITATPNDIGVAIAGGSGHTIGGTTAADINVISGNTNYGVKVLGSTGNTMLGNYIGVGEDVLPRPNGIAGVEIFTASSNIIGTGLTPNIISGNTSQGIAIYGSDTTTIENNRIGTDLAGSASLPNNVGIRITNDGATTSNYTTITQSNIVAHNAVRGISLPSTGIGHQILGALVYSNSGPGIDLGENFATANDAGDTDSGNANNYQNYPDITSAAINGANVEVVLSQANSGAAFFKIHVFKADASTLGGEELLGSSNCEAVATLNPGPFTLSVPVGSLVAGNSIVATTTSYSDGGCTTVVDGTSEFSPAVTIDGTYTWNNALGGNWSESTKWTPNGIPGAGDTAIISLNGTYTVTLTGGESAANLTIGGGTGTQTLSMGSNPLTVSGMMTIQSSGILQNGGGTLSVTGATDVFGFLSWGSGTISGAGALTIKSGGTANLLSPSTKTLNGKTLTVDVSGTVNWSGTGAIALIGSAAIVNAGLFDMQGDATLSSSTGTFTNTGTLRKNSSPGTTLFANLTLSHSGAGLLHVQTGTLDLSTANINAQIDVENGAKLLVNSDTVTLGTGATVVDNVPSGPIEVSGGTLTINENLNMPRLDQISGVINGTGLVSHVGAFNWTAGTLSGSGTTIISTGGSLSLTGVASKSLQRLLSVDAGRPVTNSGTGGISMGLGANITNNGNWNNQASSAFNFNSCSGCAFTNGGLFQISSGQTTFNNGVNFVNTSVGTTQVDTAGSLEIQGAGSNDGAFTITSPGEIRFNMLGSFAFNSGATVTGTGALHLQGGPVNFNTAIFLPNLLFDGGTIGGAGAVTHSGLFTWNGGTLGGTGTTTIGAGGSLTIATGATKLVSRTLTIDTGRSVTSTASAGFQFGSGGSITNNGAWDNQTTNTITDSSCGGCTFTNGGTFTATAPVSFGTNINYVNTSTTNVPSTGSIELFQGGSSSGSISIESPGFFRINAFGTFTFNASTTVNFITTTVGQVILQAGTMSIPSPHTVQIPFFAFNGGTLDGTGTLRLTNGASWSSGTMQGGGITEVADGAGLTIGGAGPTLNNRTLSILAGATGGTVSWTSGSINLQNGGNITTNAGTVAGLFHAQFDGAIQNGGAAGGFLNNGTFRKSASTGTTQIQTTLTNNGLLDLQSGITQTTAGFTQNPGGTTRLLLGGLTAGTQYAQLQTPPNPTINGTVDIDLNGPYDPVGGSTFTLISFTGGTYTGTYTPAFPALLNGKGWSDIVNTSGLEATVTGGGADINIATTAPTALTPSQTYNYTVTITNQGPDPATNLTFVESLSAGTVTSHTPTGCTSSSNNASSATCYVAALGSGASVSIQVFATAPASGTVGHTGSYIMDIPPTDPDGTDNGTTTNATVAAADADLSLLVTATPTPPATTTPGGTINYVFQISNAGPATATGVQLNVTLPSGVTYSSVVGATSCTGSPVLTCTGITAIAASGSTNVTVNVTADAIYGGSRTVSGTVTSAVADSVPANNGPVPATANVASAQLHVTTNSDSGDGSLRKAITDANDATICPSGCTISFAISSGPQTITVLAPLPMVTRPNVVIDGTTQPGFAGTPLILIDGTSAGSGSIGLHINATGHVVRGLSVQNFTGPGASGFGVNGVSGAQILGNVTNNNTLGIDLGINGPTANDTGDPDTGANDLQNFPVISSAVFNAGNLNVTLSVDSPSTGSMRIDVFQASGSGEGQTFLGSDCRSTPLSNDNLTIPTTAISAGATIVTTATSYTGGGCTTVASGTSEYSAVFTTTGCTAATVPITAAGSTCPSAAGLTASITPVPGASYAWGITNGTITSTTTGTSIIYTAGGSGSTILNVTVTDGAGCVNTGSHTVTITNNPTATITAPATICALSTGNTASVPVQGGATYAWSITNGTITSATNIDTITFTAGSAGTTTLNVTVTASGCTSNGSQNVTINPFPTATITAPPNVCALSTSNAASVNPTAAATYAWSITNGTITSPTTGTSITFDAGATGTVTLNVTVTSGGCSTPASQNVPITPIPSSTITTTTSTCPNTPGLSASVPITAGATYAWSITNGTITSATNTDTITFTAGASGTTTLFVTVNSSGCSSNGSQAVTITSNPVATITAPATVCSLSTGNSASVPVQFGATYAWSITNGTITSATNTDTITFTAGSTGATTLNVTVTSSGGCVSNGSHNATINPLPAATITAPPNVCALSTSNNASVNPTGGATYAWSITNGTITSATTGTSVTFDAGSTGNVTLNVTVTAGGCSTPASQTVPIVPVPAATISSVTATCPNTPGLVASVPVTAGATYAWSITNGTITSATNADTITYTAGAAGTTTLSVTVTVSSCSSTDTHAVTINSSPVATITTPTAVCANSTGNNASVAVQAGAVYSWAITNGTITSATNGASIVFTAGATGTVGLSVSVTQGSCTSNGSTTIPITASPTVTITGPTQSCPSTTFTLDAGGGFSSYLWSTGATSQSIAVSQTSSSVTYSVTVTNGGCSATDTHTVTLIRTAFVIIDAPSVAQPNQTDLPANVLADAGATFSWTISNGTITGPANTNAITFSVGASGTTSLTVSATKNGCTVVGTHTVAIGTASAAAADLAITKTAVSSVQAGGSLLYTIGVANNGPDPATNVLIIDTLPAGTTFTGMNSGPWNCALSGNQIQCTGTAFAGSTTSILITVNAPAQGGAITNIVEISASEADPNPTNNIASVTTNVVAAPPTCATVPPSLLAPSDGATITSPQTFSWTAVQGALEYELWTVTGNLTTIAGGTPNTSLTLSLPSGPGAWFVVARLGGGCEPLRSAQRSYTVSEGSSCGTHALPQITSPSAGSSNDSPVTISWNPVPQAIGYRVWIEANGTAPQDIGTTNGTISLIAELPPGSIIVYVDALFGGCPSTRSPSVTFNVSRPDPCATRGAATPTSPANNTTVGTSAVELQWLPAINADGYRVWYSQDGGTPAVLGTTTNETALHATLSPGSIVWWLEGLYNGCASTESVRFLFTIPQSQQCSTSLPALVAPQNNSTHVNGDVTFAWTAVQGALNYQVWLAASSGTPTLLGSTTGTTFKHTLGPGEYEWFVRVSVDRCPARDSQESHFALQTPPNCVAKQRPVPISPMDGATLTSPVEFSWSAPPTATSYEVFAIRGNGLPQLIGSTTSPELPSVSLGTGDLRWFVRAHFNGCPPLDSEERLLEIIAPVEACTPLTAPLINAPGQISSGVQFLIQWTPIAGATSYQLELAANANFAGAETIVTTATQHELVRTATVYARVRAIDSNCRPIPGISAFGPTSAIFILSQQGNEGSAPANGNLLTYKIPISAQFAGHTFTATVKEAWLTVSPSSGVVGTGGALLTVTANTVGLPLGTSLAAVTITLTSPSAGNVQSQGTTLTIPTVSVSLVTPVTPSPKSGPPPDALIIPAVAHADGVNSRFQSDVRVSNTSPQLIKYQLTFTPSGGAGISSGKQTTFSIEPGHTIALDDILKSWFGTGTDSAIGTLEIRPLTQTTTSTSSAALSGLPNLVTFAASRTFNVTSNGTFGQFIPAIPFANFVGRSLDFSKPTLLSLQQIAQSDRYRTNLGLVEGSGQPASLLVKVFGDGGAKLTEFPVDLAGGEHTQLNAFLSQRGISSLSDGRVEIQVLSPGGKVTAYASVLDNQTSDPLLVTPVTLTDSGSTRWVVPGVADLTSGFANWQTDMRIFNAGSAPVDATLTFYPQGNGAPKTKTATIPAGQVVQFDKTLSSLFGVTNDGGAVHISTATPTRLITTARTYNQTTGGTYGQFISAVTPFEAAGLGSRPLQLLQVEESNRFRSNIGLAEVTGNTVKLEIAVIPPDAKITTFTEVTLQPNEFRQIGSLLKSVGLDGTFNARVTVRVIEGTGRVTAYASVIDAITNDPTYIPAQ